MDLETSAFKMAVNAAVAAGEHVLRYWPNVLNRHFDKQKTLEVFAKNEGVGNYATIADIESEKIIINAIKTNPLFSRHQIVAEESDGFVSDSEYQWFIDPIDGTIAFKNGAKEFGISIGLLRSGTPLLGVIAFPAEGIVLSARKGQGAYLHSFAGKELLKLPGHKPEPVDPTRMFLGADAGYKKRKEMYEIIGRISDRVNYVVTYASACFVAYRIAAGNLHGYIHSSITPYDIGAAACIIEECGGALTDIRGKPFDWTRKESTLLMAQTPALHKQILKLIRG
jgi:myo-inositol-1(or 4)-monophosphatase